MWRVWFLESILAFSLLTTGTIADDPDLSVLGENSWYRFSPAWSLTVNDQCLYEFVFQFEHDENLPMGEKSFQGNCAFKDPQTKKPFIADDGYPYLDRRQHWERFPDYVWATIGFNHMSLDWLPCGHRPQGHALPHYDFSFFRVTPEFRAQTMTCDVLTDEQVITPGEQVCDFNQESREGMGFFVVPGALVNRIPVINMPENFERPKLGNGPVPHVGLRSWDQVNLPQFPGDWNNIPLYMSTYAGDLVMWQAHVPYKFVSGDEDHFMSGASRYFETTVRTLPDTYAADYDVSDGVIRFIMIGKSQLCRGDFEKAQAAYGGAPVFPYYPSSALANRTNGITNDGSGDAKDGNNKNKSGVSAQNGSFLPTIILVSFLYLIC